MFGKYLLDWASREDHKPLLLRGARQVGKSTAVQELSKSFTSFVEVNFEKQPQYKALFNEDLDVKRITAQISAIYGTSIEPGKTLLFLDEIQECPQAIMALRFFREDLELLTLKTKEECRRAPASGHSGRRPCHNRRGILERVFRTRRAGHLRMTPA